MNRGDIIAWIVVDPNTGELILRCASRSEARRVAAESGARYCRVVVA